MVRPDHRGTRVREADQRDALRGRCCEIEAVPAFETRAQIDRALAACPIHRAVVFHAQLRRDACRDGLLRPRAARPAKRRAQDVVTIDDGLPGRAQALDVHIRFEPEDRLFDVRTGLGIEHVPVEHALLQGGEGIAQRRFLPFRRARDGRHVLIVARPRTPPQRPSGSGSGLIG